MELLALKLLVFIMGPAVLISYVIGFKRAENPMDLWGGVDGIWRKISIPFMFVAAVGFLAAAYVLLFQMSEAELASLRMPWGTAGNGLEWAFWGYLIYLIPSALWLETTHQHLVRKTALTKWVCIGNLTLVTVGLVMLGLLAIGGLQDGVGGAGIVLAGVIGMFIQSTINDNVIWVLKFPW